MKKLACILGSIAILPCAVQADVFDFSQSGLAGVYYGVMQTRRQNNYNNMPNRVVYRQDGRFEGAYKFADETRFGAHADYTLALRQHDKDYNGDLSKIFEDNLSMCDDYRRAIIQVIEVAELNEDYEVKIKLEEFLTMFNNYRKQASVWYKYAKRYEGDYKSFDVHFEEFTKYINTSEG